MNAHAFQIQDSGFRFQISDFRFQAQNSESVTQSSEFREIQSRTYAPVPVPVLVPARQLRVKCRMQSRMEAEAEAGGRRQIRCRKRYFINTGSRVRVTRCSASAKLTLTTLAPLA